MNKLLFNLNNMNSKKRISFITAFFLFISVFIITIYTLVRPAVSMTDTYICGMDEHIHTENCYTLKPETTLLTCNIQQYYDHISHTHNEFCYDSDGCLMCTLEECEHIHDSSCYDENGVIVCGYVYHNHSAECLTTVNEPVDVLVLSCTKEAHIHTVACKNQSDEDAGDEEIDNQQSSMFYLSSVGATMSAYASENGEDEEDIVNASDILKDPHITLNDSNTESITLQYQLENGSWKDASEGEILPVDTDYRIMVKYSYIDIDSLINSNYQLVLENIPHWLDAEKSGEILYNGQTAATITLAENNGSYTLATLL